MHLTTLLLTSALTLTLPLVIGTPLQHPRQASNPIGCQLLIADTNIENVQGASCTSSNTATSTAVLACCSTANGGTPAQDLAGNHVCNVGLDAGFDAVKGCATNTGAVCVVT